MQQQRMLQHQRPHQLHGLPFRPPGDDGEGTSEGLSLDDSANRTPAAKPGADFAAALFGVREKGMASSLPAELPPPPPPMAASSPSGSNGGRRAPRGETTVELPQSAQYFLDVGKGLTILAAESVEGTLKASKAAVEIV